MQITEIIFLLHVLWNHEPVATKFRSSTFPELLNDMFWGFADSNEEHWIFSKEETNYQNDWADKIWRR